MGRYELEFEISRYKLLNIEQMNNKVLLYNTGNYIQYLVINHKENNLNDICVYIYTHI